jgi:hypothetical protein
MLLCSHGTRGSSFVVPGRVIGQGAPHEAGEWLSTPIERPRDHWRGVANSRTLVSAYLKGGVGEITLAANLGAYLRSGKKCVLPIDLDFQGSLSSMLFGQELAVRHASKLAGDRLISGDRAPVDVPLLAPKVGLKTGEKSPGRLEVVAAYCDLAEADNRIMVEWLSMAASMRPFQGREIYATPRASIELAHSLAEATAATGRRRGNAAGMRDDDLSRQAETASGYSRRRESSPVVQSMLGALAALPRPTQCKPRGQQPQEGSRNESSHAQGMLTMPSW